MSCAYATCVCVYVSFHMPRTRAIFDLVFSVPMYPGGPRPTWSLEYLTVDDVGIPEDVAEARRSRYVTGAYREWCDSGACLPDPATLHCA